MHVWHPVAKGQARLLPEDVILTMCTMLDFGVSERARVLSACDHGRIDWGLLLSAALGHRVAPLVYLRLQECNGLSNVIPSQIKQDFCISLSNANQRKMELRSAIAALSRHFAGLAHEVIFVKGTAIGLRFGDKYSCLMQNDVDAAVKPVGSTKKQEIPKVLYRYIESMPEHLDILYRKRLIELDAWCPHDIAGVCYGWFSANFGDVWGRAIKVPTEDTAVLIPCDSDLLLISAINFVRKRHLRLRNLFDVGLLIRSVCLTGMPS